MNLHTATKAAVSYDERASFRVFPYFDFNGVLSCDNVRDILQKFTTKSHRLQLSEVLAVILEFLVAAVPLRDSIMACSSFAILGHFPAQSKTSLTNGTKSYRPSSGEFRRDATGAPKMPFQSEDYLAVAVEAFSKPVLFSPFAEDHRA